MSHIKNHKTKEKFYKKNVETGIIIMGVKVCIESH